ncbi:MAG: hypothetical protein A2046_00530 [Bacteroidetes bacterium GWA2_30_7]|nr:MAG: hypothetical protein A2046_00530 [Bacteroidetes bacterium GWA2_30_7]
MNRKCLWCLKSEPNVSFINKAHTIPKSLGGQNYNRNVCDNCNEYFGNCQDKHYSIEEALKETFNISRQRILLVNEPKRKVGRFKSKFFEVKERNGIYRLIAKSSFRFNAAFQSELCRTFKRGLYKMYFEELNRQREIGYDEKYNIIREFARYNIGEMPIFYFNRNFGAILMLKNEAETPILYFDRMLYLYTDNKFAEIEFLGHVFGFPISEFKEEDIQIYFSKTYELKKKFFKDFVNVERLTDIDFTLKILNG